MEYLDEQAKRELLVISRTTLQSYFSTGRCCTVSTTTPALLEHAGAFVSLHRGEELRGCIGQIIADRELYRIVQSCTLSAALEDPRFDPVTEEDVPLLTIEISVLTPMRRVTNASEVEVGRHGLYIIHGVRRGLLLPQVATNYGWNREMFLAQTCRKAGLPEQAWRDPSTSIQVFEAQVFADYHAARQGAAG